MYSTCVPVLEVYVLHVISLIGFKNSARAPAYRIPNDSPTKPPAPSSPPSPFRSINIDGQPILAGNANLNFGLYVLTW